MNNKSNIVTQKSKHGIFSYYKNDEYIGKSLREYGEFSEGEVHLIKQLTKTNDNVIEVGSNIGTHTIPLAKHLSQGGLLYALEPQSQNYKILIKNINQNDLQNIKVFKIAASNKKSEAYMNLFDENETNNFGDARIFNKIFTNFEKVSVSTLDELFFHEFNENKKLVLVKCDAQGQETNIINGSKKIIEKFKPLLYVENDNIEQSKNLIETIKSLHYSLFWHIVPMFNSKNYLNNSKNIFPKKYSLNMLCIHKNTRIALNEDWKKNEIKDSDFHPLKKT